MLMVVIKPAGEKHVAVFGLKSQHGKTLFLVRGSVVHKELIAGRDERSSLATLKGLAERWEFLPFREVLLENKKVPIELRTAWALEWG